MASARKKPCISDPFDRPFSIIYVDQVKKVIRFIV
jgi:hypothetical protein